MYKLYKTITGDDAAIKTNDDGSFVSFIFAPDNTDYQEYLKWVELGNQPEPADEPASQPADEV
jgi:hypothetical protein